MMTLNNGSKNPEVAHPMERKSNKEKVAYVTYNILMGTVGIFQAVPYFFLLLARGHIFLSTTPTSEVPYNDLRNGRFRK